MFISSSLVRMDRGGWLAIVAGLIINCISPAAEAQNPPCDPSKVIGADGCANCHVSESASWKRTPHFQTFEQLSQNPRAKEISQKLGLRSIKRSEVCLDCHFTTQESDGRLKPIAGVSCESCHGAAKDWVNVHNQYLSRSGNKEGETLEQAQVRFHKSTQLGMNNTQNLYQIASNCLQCHTVPNERLVNVGGHLASSPEFEFVAWSQGIVRHNYMRSGGQFNAVSAPERLRVMYVVGLLADLEYSTRATSLATEKSDFGVSLAQRAAGVSLKLYHVQQKINDPHLQQALLAFAAADLRLNNQQSLGKIADTIKQAGERFAVEADGKQLAAIDSLLPSPSQYR